MDWRDLHDLFGHMAWADARVWQTVLATDAAAASDDIRRLLCHVHTVQHVYLQVWQGTPIAPRDPASFASAADIARYAASYHAALPAFTASLGPRDLQQPIELPWAGQLVQRFGSARPATLAQTMQQVALHTSHHRGQVLLHLRSLGAEPPLLDFIAWVWSGQPDADWGEITAEAVPR